MIALSLPRGGIYDSTIHADDRLDMVFGILDSGGNFQYILFLVDASNEELFLPLPI